MFDLIDFSFDEPAENLALEECLLKPMLKAPLERPLVRIWENRQTCIVLGRAEKASQQVQLDQCQKDNITVLRRTSGGGTVVHGIGNLNISFFLPYEAFDGLKNIHQSYEIILAWVRKALHQCCGVNTHMKGSSDLSIGDKKISGTAQARKRCGMLHHMTLLVNFNLDDIQTYLREPEKRPDYRGERTHRNFVTTLHKEGFELTRSALIKQFLDILPAQQIQISQGILDEARELAQLKYRQDSWTLEGLDPV